MKVKLEMEFDVPEEHYKDDKEDRNILDISELQNHHLGFVRQCIFDEFTNYAHVNHLTSVMTCLVSSNLEGAISHRKWANIIGDALKTVKLAPINQ
jgi:hypothetical protein